ncbi:hypothetical protein [Thermococcus stetteri]|uniref:hypothetical protein n=1 Tax=Thermococcus stetteri TaxID=49900 RepID=UPI001AEAFC0E|nr:hypothetical protein [Thermococcus stetteri]MBP1911504.1 hypothetical protein [Thermococcus stetteri]
MIKTSCEKVEALVKKLALGFVFLFLAGFLILYYEVRVLACATTELCPTLLFEYSPLNQLGMIVAVFVIGTLFFGFALYYSSNGGE